MRNVRAGGVDLVGVGHVIARRAWVGARQLHLQSGSAGRPRGTGPALGHIDVRHSRMAGRPGRQANTWPYRGKSLTAQHLLSIRGYLSILVEVCDVRCRRDGSFDFVGPAGRTAADPAPSGARPCVVLTRRYPLPRCTDEQGKWATQYRCPTTKRARPGQGGALKYAPVVPNDPLGHPRHPRHRRGRLGGLVKFWCPRACSGGSVCRQCR